MPAEFWPVGLVLAALWRAELLVSSSAIVLASLEQRPSLEARAELAGRVLGAEARAWRERELLLGLVRPAEPGEAAL